MINKNSIYNKNIKRIKKMIDEEGTLLLTNETTITDDILDKIKKIVINTSYQGKVFKNIFENENKGTCDLINLEEVNFSNTTSSIIHCFSFENCKKLKSIELPLTIKMLHDWCFAYCNQLESVILYGIETIHYGVFEKCISLKYLFISDSIKKISEYAFDDIPKEQEIKIICPDRFYNYFKERFLNASINEKDYFLK